MNLRQLFLRHLAPTSIEPMAIQIDKASSVYLYDNNEKAYIDLIGGISVANVGHSHPEVINAISEQVAKYMHIMVYGELVQSPQVRYAERLTSVLPDTLNSVYFTNSGAEAVEGAMKLAKRATRRTQFIAFKHSYHGSTQGALSLLGDEYFRNAYRPLLPDIIHIEYNNPDDLEYITEQTAAVIIEPIQAEAGVLLPIPDWIQSLSRRCKEKGVLLILDEIQTGFGRTGSLFAFEKLNIVPDILLLGKALGGGMPLGAFVADESLTSLLAHNPILGHITTFGGHPVSCAAGLASLEILLREKWIQDADRKGLLFKEKLSKNPIVKSITQKGLMLAIAFEDFDTVKKVIHNCMNANQAVFSDWFLFASNCIRIVPPLCISDEVIEIACNTIAQACNDL